MEGSDSWVSFEAVSLEACEPLGGSFMGRGQEAAVHARWACLPSEQLVPWQLPPAPTRVKKPRGWQPDGSYRMF